MGIFLALEKNFSLGPISITYYMLFIMSGIFLASFIGVREAKRIGIDKDILIDGILYTVPISIVGARIYYIIFEFDSFGFNIIKMVGLDGNGLRGLAIHGAIISSFIFVYYYAKKKEMNIWKSFDLVAPGFLIAQAIGRWGNFVNQEAHGPATTYEFLKETLKLPDFIVDQMKIGLTYYHPTFLYESIWNIVGFILIIFIRRMKFTKTGDLIFLYVIWYGLGRFFIELMRTDSLMIFGLKQNVIISAILFFGGIIGLGIKWKYFKNESYLENIKDRRLL